MGSLIPSSCMKANSLPANPVGREKEEGSNEAGKFRGVCDGQTGSRKEKKKMKKLVLYNDLGVLAAELTYCVFRFRLQEDLLFLVRMCKRKLSHSGRVES